MAVVAVALASRRGVAQPAVAAVASAETVRPIAPPRVPLPSEQATAGVTRFSFIAYGDTRGRQDGMGLQAEHALVVESMLGTIRGARTSADSIRFVLQSGDAVTNGSVERQWTVSYVPIVERLTRDGGVPYFLSVGNHDVGSSSNLVDRRRLAGLRNYFAANRALLPPDGSPRRLAGYPTFAFGYGNAFFIAVDSHIPDDEKQLAWMTRQLESLDRSRYEHVVVFFHHPVLSSGPHGVPTEPQVASIRARWMPLFREHHVRLLFTGHDHVFEHWVERWTDAAGPHRLDQIVTGGGGAPPYGYVGQPDVVDYLAAGAAQQLSLQQLARPAEAPAEDAFHYVVVRVDGPRIAIEVVGVGGARGFAPYGSSAETRIDAVR